MRPFIPLGALAALTLLACGGDATPEPTSTPAAQGPEATDTPEAEPTAPPAVTKPSTGV